MIISSVEGYNSPGTAEEDRMNDRLTYTEAELLTSHTVAEPLIVDGVRCHGGFDADGCYVSPRTLHRGPAIAAWQAQHRRDTATDVLDVELDSFPAHYPNVAQAKLLLQHEVTDPIVATLTRVGTVEGFGAFLRFASVDDLQAHVVEDISGTALGHLSSGLIEAHARDEAGHGDIAGHNRMWFAARDLAFDHPVTEDQTATMLERLGVSPPAAAPSPDGPRRQFGMVERRLPLDIAAEVEQLLDTMCGLLLIEITAFHLFRWAEEVLADPELCAADGAAARIVGYIRADETPHVEYLRTALSELRERTIVGDSGRHHSGRDVLDALWQPAVEAQRHQRRNDLLDLTRREVERAVRERFGNDDLLDEFDSIGDAHRDEEGVWHEPPARAQGSP